jgi:glycosyltransferase involved in cell wall biosynthesis
MPLNLPRIWRTMRQADAVHTPIGGDVGTFGILMALAQRKPLFVRYCGVWGRAHTLAQRFWFWLLIRIAGGRNVVLATGGSDRPPTMKNLAIQWIFATSMRQAEMASLPRRSPWQIGDPLTLITVGRQEPGKNTDRVIQSLALVRAHYAPTTLDIVGDGSCLPALRQLTTDLNLIEAVTFHGKVNHDRVIAILGRTHVFCFPTDSEGFPKAVHEALACGLPVITTPVSVLPQLIGDRNGILLNDIQPETIAQAILDLISDEQRFREMGRSAQRTAQAYSLEAWRDQIGQKLCQAWGPLPHYTKRRNARLAARRLHETE